MVPFWVLVVAIAITYWLTMQYEQSAVTAYAAQKAAATLTAQTVQQKV